MATIDYTFIEQNTNQVLASATPTDISGAAITFGNFTAGKKYLLLCTYQITEDSNGLASIRTVHGSTPFGESSQTIISTSTSTFRYATGFMTVWTAVSAEGIKLQHSASAGNVNTNYIGMLKLNLSDDLVENTDWFYAERANDDALSTTPTDGASITFSIPGTWLILSYALIDATDTAATMTSRIVRSGEASSSLPEGIIGETSTANVVYPLLQALVVTTTASNTFKEQSEASTTAHTRLHSSIFAINLDKFAAKGTAYTEADTVLSATNYASQLQTTSITPTVSGPVWVLAACGFDAQNISREFEARVQVDGADSPANQTTNNYQLSTSVGTSGLQEIPFMLTTVQTLDTSAHTINFDGSADSAVNSSAAQTRALMAVSLELAGVGFHKFQGKFFGKFGGKL